MKPRKTLAIEKRMLPPPSGLNVEIKPGGRAVITDTKGYRPQIEVQYIFDKEREELLISELLVVLEGAFEDDFPADPLRLPDLAKIFTARTLAQYDQALADALIGPDFAIAQVARRAPRRRPQPGRPLDTDFYRRLLAAYRALQLDRHPSPAAELARRYGEKPGTVRSWLSRGRRHLESRED